MRGRSPSEPIKYVNLLQGSMEPKHTVMAAVAGFVLMLVGFAAYVVSPSVAYQAVFVVGVVLLVAGYAMIYMMNRQVSADVVEMEDDEDRNGFFYILDEDYSAPVGDASIEDLSGRKGE